MLLNVAPADGGKFHRANDLAKAFANFLAKGRNKLQLFDRREFWSFRTELRNLKDGDASERMKFSASGIFRVVTEKVRAIGGNDYKDSD